MKIARLEKCPSCRCDFPSTLLHPLHVGPKETDPICPLCAEQVMEAMPINKGKITLTGPQAAILRLLIPSFPNALARSYIADAAGVSESSSGFEKNLSRLRSLGLIDYPSAGKAQATKMLFPEGLK